MMEKATLPCNNQSPLSPNSSSSSRKMNYFNLNTNISTKPSWLLSTLADIEERMKMLAMNPNEEDEGDTFAERAESYYRKRPQLLALLQDLYNAYLTLSDKYSQSSNNTNNKFHNHHRRHSSQVSDYYYDTVTDVDSDLESSLSYQQPTNTMLGVNDHNRTCESADDIVAELVMKNVELELVVEELGLSERRSNESSRKIELQRSLLEVLESERLVLLNENARLEYRAAALAEENKGLASESVFMRRKAGELARCVLKMREDQRVCMLSRKIEDLQGQIHGLEKRNKEYYEQLLLRSTTSDKGDHHDCNVNKNSNKKKKSEVVFEGCFQMRKLNQKLMKRNHSQSASKGNKGSNWWERVKSMDLFLCAVNPTCSA